MARHLTAIPESIAREIYEAFVEYHIAATSGDYIKSWPTTEQGSGDTDAWYSGSPLLVRNLEDTGGFGIAWEEGPYEWPFTIEDAEKATELAEKHGVLVEANNGWAVGFYPA